MRLDVGRPAGGTAHRWERRRRARRGFACCDTRVCGCCSASVIGPSRRKAPAHTSARSALPTSNVTSFLRSKEFPNSAGCSRRTRTGKGLPPKRFAPHCAGVTSISISLKPYVSSPRRTPPRSTSPKTVVIAQEVPRRAGDSVREALGAPQPCMPIDVIHARVFALAPPVVPGRSAGIGNRKWAPVTRDHHEPVVANMNPNDVTAFLVVCFVSARMATRKIGRLTFIALIIVVVINAALHFSNLATPAALPALFAAALGLSALAARDACNLRPHGMLPYAPWRPGALAPPFRGCWCVAAGGALPGLDHHTIARDQYVAYDFIRRGGKSFGSLIIATINGEISGS